MKKYFHFILILSLFIASSCGNNPNEEAYQAIDQALTFLSDGECDKAIEILEELKEQDKNPVFLKTYASAYACKAGFDSIRFVSTDVAAINSLILLQSISRLSFSDETTVDSANYLSMKKALNILGRSDFKQVTRRSDFGKRHGEDMGVQVLIYSIMQFGKYLNWYGNVDIVGKKGAGSNTNDCFLNYTYAPAQGVIGTLPASNACQGSTFGHPDLSGANLIKRMCEGITLMTNIFDTLNNIDLTGSSSLSSLENIVTEINSYRTDANAAGVGYLLDVTSPVACEALLANAADMNNAQLLFALTLEKEHE